MLHCLSDTFSFRCTCYNDNKQFCSVIFFLDLKTLWICSPAGNEISHTYGVHVDPIGVGPFVLEVLLQSLPQRVWNLVEADELPNSDHLGVIARCPRVQPLDNG